MAAPANAQEKWLYVSGIWDGTVAPVYTDYNNILGNSVAANQDAVDRLLGYAYAQGYTGLFLYNMNRYMSGASFTVIGKAIIRDFMLQARAMGLSVGGSTSTSANSLDAYINFNNTTLDPDQRFDCIITENEWWWWSYNDTNQGPCGEFAFIQMKNTLNSRKANLVAANIELYAYVGFARQVGYTYSGNYVSNCGTVVRNGSTVVGSDELDQLIGIVDKFGIHDYIVNETGYLNQVGPCGSPPCSNEGTPNYGYSRGRFLHFSSPVDVFWIISTEDEFSGPWMEGKLDLGDPPTNPRKGIEDAYDYIAHTLGGIVLPPQQGSPISFDAETNAGILANVSIIGITNFKYNEMVSDTHQLNTKNGSTMWVQAGNDQSSGVFPGTFSLSGEYLDDLLPVGATYTISWSLVSGPTGSTFTNGSTLTPTFNYTLPGVYTVRLSVSDSDITVTDDVILTVTGSVSLMTVAISTASDETCYLDCTAQLLATPTNGTGPYTYVWDTGATGNTLTGVCDSDTHSVTVTDSLGATATDSYTYSSPAVQLTLLISQVNVSTFGGADGEILATGGGGSGFYQYSIDGGATWEPLVADPAPFNFTGLTAGSYTVEIQDSNGCTMEPQSILLTEPAQAPSIVVTNVVTPACNSISNTGSINLTVTGGTPGYTYVWTGPPPFVDPGTQDLSNLYSGTYVVVVTDSLGQTATQTIVVGISSPVQNATVTDVTCYGAGDGWITVNVTGGTAPYTYLWSTGSTFSTIQNLRPGNYVCTVRDANNCSSTQIYTIVEPSQIILTASYTNPSSTGTDDGTITVTATGGTVAGAYTYLWSNGETTSTIEDLPSGSYTCVVSDDNDCSANITIVLFAQDYLEVAAIRSKCCMADLVYKYLKYQRIDPKKSKCLLSKIKYLKLASCVLDKYVNDLTCISLVQVYNMIENMNAICGCCDCEFNTSVFDDTI